MASDGLVKVYAHCKDQMMKAQAVPILKFPFALMLRALACAGVQPKHEDLGYNLAFHVRSTPNTQV